MPSNGVLGFPAKSRMAESAASIRSAESVMVVPRKLVTPLADEECAQTKQGRVRRIHDIKTIAAVDMQIDEAGHDIGAAAIQLAVARQRFDVSGLLAGCE